MELLFFLGVSIGDRKESAVWLASKFVNLRIFSDEQGGLNSSILEKKGEALIVSQFTLYADCEVGRRPSFTKAAPPDVAKSFYETFLQAVKSPSDSIAHEVKETLQYRTALYEGVQSIKNRPLSISTICDISSLIRGVKVDILTIAHEKKFILHRKVSRLLEISLQIGNVFFMKRFN